MKPDLLVAEFLDSEAGRVAPPSGASDKRRGALLLCRVALEDHGAEPRLLDGEQVRALLLEGVARRLGAGDELAASMPELARAFFRFVAETQMAPNAFEVEMTLSTIDAAFIDAARSVAPGERIAGRTETVRHRADKVGRNDACPCGSGKKFKQCCMKLGGGS